MIQVISYDARVSKMKAVGDESIQLQRAKTFAMRLRTKARKAGTLEEKVAILAAQKEADTVVRKLRSNIFDLEDMLSSRAAE